MMIGKIGRTTMKLRNKKTGEVKKMWKDNICLSFSDCNKVYYSLAELNQEWEDYKPAEPLIKDEKIRKVVRAWAEANDITEINVASSGYELWGGIDDWCIHFRGNPFKDIKPLKYTIAELCGEEEEYYMIKENK